MTSSELRAGDREEPPRFSPWVEIALVVSILATCYVAIQVVSS